MMRRTVALLLFSILPLSAQSTLVSVIRQPRATAAEFTVPIFAVGSWRDGERHCFAFAIDLDR